MNYSAAAESLKDPISSRRVDFVAHISGNAPQFLFS